MKQAVHAKETAEGVYCDVIVGRFEHLTGKSARRAETA